MSRFQFTITRLAGVVATLAVVVAVYMMNPMLGLVLVIGAGLAGAGYLLREDLVDPLDRCLDFLGRPVGRVGLVLVGLWVVTTPAVLYYDPATFAPTRRGHIDRPPREMYLLFSDDVAYAAASRTWERTVANLLVPHNTHIVPCWRVLTWVLVASAGNLERLPQVLAVASYGIIIAVMLMAGRFVMRETGRASLGLTATSLIGTSSVMLTASMWYSGGQPLWAGFAILSTLWFAQSFRRNGRWINLGFAAIGAGVAGGLWAAGNLAGPVTAVYLWFDGRRRCRLAAAVPLIATAATVALLFTFAARPMDSTVSFHGRTVKEAADPVQGAITTAQAIPENLIVSNLGLQSEPTPSQGIVLTLVLLALWASSRWRRHGAVHAAHLADDKSSLVLSSQVDARSAWPSFAFNPLECAGAALVLGCYLLEWTFRGYLEFHSMRTISPYAIVPWYDVIPQVGAVLFVIGWVSGPQRSAGLAPLAVGRRPAPPTRTAVLGLVLMTLALIVVNRPRIDALIRGTAPPVVPGEYQFFKISRLVTMRATALRSIHVDWQRKYLQRLDQVEPVARRLGIGQDGIRAAFGFIFIPASTGRLLLNQREVYDVAAILNLPAHGRAGEPFTVRAALERYLLAEPEPRPPWLPADEPWPVK
jgi:hypothetical protein